VILNEISLIGLQNPILIIDKLLEGEMSQISISKRLDESGLVDRPFN